MAFSRQILLSLALALLAGTSGNGAQMRTLDAIRGLASTAPGTPVSARGTVTRFRPGRSIAIDDATGSIYVYTEQADPLSPGDVVEVSGVADLDDERAPSIDRATYRKVGTTDAPVPVPASAASLRAGQHDAGLVSVDATLDRFETGRYEYGLVLHAEGVTFTAWVLRDAAGRIDAIAPGSRVRVTGTVSRTLDSDGHAGFELLMRTGADARVLAPASWWSAQRVSTAAVGLAGATAVLLSYVFLLRRQVSRQTTLIAERLKVEAGLEEQYRQAQKMESVGRLAGGIAHDFNNIMTIVLGHSDMLAMDLKDHPELMESVDEIRRAADRAAEVTRHLLAFGRRQHLKIEPLDLNGVVTTMASLLKRVLGGGVDVEAREFSEPVIVSTDRVQLEQALLNLAVNGRDAMPDGGLLTLSVDRRRDAAGRALGVVKVTDTGSGIPPEAQPHVFEPFFTTKDVGEGSGLGLAMVYGFVQQTGGAIAFTTTEGQGTTFELTFPLAQQEEPATRG